MSLNAELQHDLMKCLSKLETVTTRDLVTHAVPQRQRDGRTRLDHGVAQAHLVENLSETKSTARFIQQRFEQDGSKLDSIQTQLMQLTDHNEPQLFRASPVAPVVEHSRPPPPSTIPRDASPIETEYAEASPRRSRDEEAPCQVGQENAEEIREATPASNEASLQHEVAVSSMVKKPELSLECLRIGRDESARDCGC
ncbi:hypothetical protein FOZ62_028503 [Perkinsus olseni]|uniref:Uncharacterized protein n=1 Tax=Perkinsus olseni TaxID=32597 RepID=A0A7J6QHS3_PEROL|nr:hypothetical protein FOZ62_028503 [Perkinsus olseni]